MLIILNPRLFQTVSNLATVILTALVCSLPNYPLLRDVIRRRTWNWLAAAEWAHRYSSSSSSVLSVRLTADAPRGRTASLSSSRDPRSDKWPRRRNAPTCTHRSHLHYHYLHYTCTVFDDAAEVASSAVYLMANQRKVRFCSDENWAENWNYYSLLINTNLLLILFLLPSVPWFPWAKNES